MSVLSFLKAVPNSKITDLKRFIFSYSTGTMMNSSVSKDKSGKYVVEICPDEVAEEDKYISEVNVGFAEKIVMILKKYHVGRWNGFNKIDRMVMDGDGFSLDVSFQNGSRIHAHGYMRYPKNYSSVRGELDTAFMNLYNSATITE